MTTTRPATTTALTSPPRSRAERLRALVQVTVLTAAWVAVGWVLDLDTRVYQWLGVPFVAGFQLLVRRRPLRDLWVRDGDAFRLDRRGRALACVLVVYPLVALTILAAQGQWLNASMAAAAAVGTLPAAYAMRRLHTSFWGPATRAALLATVVGLGWMLVSIVPEMTGDASPTAMLGRGLHSLLLYVPVAFLFEEVSFRGCVDAHVQRPGERFGLLSAVFVSSLWSLWHLPLVVGSQPLGELVLTLLLVHVTIGVPLSYAWRRSGNLTLPAVAHSVIDAVRDGLSLST
jgi:membrane protease YdiL (CAAX protease family)